MATKDLLIDRAEVDRELEVPGGIEAREARLRAVQPALHRVADQQQRGGRAVVGAAARVLLGSPPELRPGRDKHLVRLSVRGDVLIDGADRRGELRSEEHT